MQLTKDKPLFFHYRFRKTKTGQLIFNNTDRLIVQPWLSNNGPTYNMGGATIAFNTVLKTFGVAKCDITDNFNKKLGRRIAFGRSCNGKAGNFGVQIPYNGAMDFASVKAEADRIANNLFTF